MIPICIEFVFKMFEMRDGYIQTVSSTNFVVSHINALYVSCHPDRPSLRYVDPSSNGPSPPVALEACSSRLLRPSYFAKRPLQNAFRLEKTITMHLSPTPESIHELGLLTSQHPRTSGSPSRVDQRRSFKAAIYGLEDARSLRAVTASFVLTLYRISAA